MSKETSKAMRRRWQENDAGAFPWRSMFTGQGLDVGSGDDPLTCALGINLPDGGEYDITKLLNPELKFDFVHASQVLEHMIDPIAAFRSWIQVLKPAGWIIGTVPDFNLYEHRTWPSKWNPGHRSTWSHDRFSFQSPCLIHAELPSWFNLFPAMELVICRIVDTSYDYRVASEGIDQTAGPDGAEAFIEFVLRKI